MKKVRVVSCRANPLLVGAEYGARNFPHNAGLLSSLPFLEQPNGHWANNHGTVVEVVTPRPAPEPAAATGPYPDGNPKAAQGAKKYDLMYLPLPAKVEVNRALEDGAKKYGKANWRLTGVSAMVYLNAAARHIEQYNEGQELASDSGVHNLGHAMACLAIIIDAAANGKLIDDRPVACVDTDALLKR